MDKINLQSWLVIILKQAQTMKISLMYSNKTYNFN